MEARMYKPGLTISGIKSCMMDGALPTDLNIKDAQSVPMHFFAFGSPVRHATEFRFEFDPQFTNGITYYVPLGEWNMPLKVLRSSNRPKPVLLLLHGLGLHPDRLSTDPRNRWS